MTNRTCAMTPAANIPVWADSLLTVPGTDASLRRNGDQLLSPTGERVAQVADGIVRTGVPPDDPSISYYSALGGTHFFERSSVAYAMTTLDTPVYHGHLRDFTPERNDAVIVDVGGGDGRNAVPWLEWGFRRVVLVDPVVASLVRLRDRLRSANPGWLEFAAAGRSRRPPVAAAERLGGPRLRHRIPQLSGLRLRGRRRRMQTHPRRLWPSADRRSRLRRWPVGPALLLRRGRGHVAAQHRPRSGRRHGWPSGRAPAASRARS